MAREENSDTLYEFDLRFVIFPGIYLGYLTVKIFVIVSAIHFQPLPKFIGHFLNSLRCKKKELDQRRSWNFQLWQYFRYFIACVIPPHSNPHVCSQGGRGPMFVLTNYCWFILPPQEWSGEYFRKSFSTNYFPWPRFILLVKKEILERAFAPK